MVSTKLVRVEVECEVVPQIFGKFSLDDQLQACGSIILQSG